MERKGKEVKKEWRKKGRKKGVGREKKRIGRNEREKKKKTCGG